MTRQSVCCPLSRFFVISSMNSTNSKFVYKVTELSTIVNPASMKVRKGLITGAVSLILGAGTYPIYNAINGNWRYNFKETNESTGDQYIYAPNYDHSSYELLTDSILPDPCAETKLTPRLYGVRSQSWRLLRKARSKRRNVRHASVNSLATLDGLHESDYVQLGQSCDQRTVVGLARHKDASASFFLPVLPDGITEKSYTYEQSLREYGKLSNVDCEFRVLLSSLPRAGLDENIQRYIEQVVKMGTYDFDREKEEELVSFVDSGPTSGRKVSKSRFEVFCLKSLIAHCMLPKNRSLTVGYGGLQLLTRLYQRKNVNDLEAMRLMCRIVCLLSVDSHLHKAIYQGGWLRVLKSWFGSFDAQLSTMAATALANLDSDDTVLSRDNDDYVDHKYHDGIVLLHPQRRVKAKVDVDIVFVHGLGGSAFRTWRQRDDILRRRSDDSTTEPSNDRQTKCWPKDWLSVDIPNCRVLAVEYNTYLSSWTSQPYDSNGRSIEVRSADLLRKLIRAGVGRRPIIWVGHSMGGLLVKQLITSASRSDEDATRSLFDNTVGSVFYSVPHRGTKLASTLIQRAHYLVLPTVEVQELQKGSSKLIELNDEFTDLMRGKGIPCLSFGEGDKTSFGLNIKTVIVPRDSAELGYGEYHEVAANHLNTCKPDNRESDIYVKLVDFVKKILSNLNDGNGRSEITNDEFAFQSTSS